MGDLCAVWHCHPSWGCYLKMGAQKNPLWFLALMGQFMKSLSSLFSTVVCSDLEQTLTETPRCTPCLLSAVICGMDWCGLCCLGQGSCVIQERCTRLQKQREAALCPQKGVNQKATWGPALRTWRTSECRTGRTWEQIVHPFTYEKTEARGCQGILPTYLPLINSFMYLTVIPECLLCAWLWSRCWGYKENECHTGSRSLSQSI